MSCRHYFWAIVLVVAGCASLFDRRSDFERGLEMYNDRRFAEAIEYFTAYHDKHPDNDTTLYYLLDCHARLGNEPGQISVLEKMAGRGIADVNVYVALVRLLRRHSRFSDLCAALARLGPPMSAELDARLVLDRRLLAELMCGAARTAAPADPLVWCVTKGHLPLFPDGKLYESDTLTNADVIVLLDRLVEPVYPRDFFATSRIPARSYLYLPYMRLVELGIMDFDAHIAPDQRASATAAARALGRMREKDHLD